MYICQKTANSERVAALMLFNKFFNRQKTALDLQKDKSECAKCSTKLEAFLYIVLGKFFLSLIENSIALFSINNSK